MPLSNTSPPTSQGSTVSWSGSNLGSLTSFKATAGAAVFEEVTNVESVVIGSGFNSRVIKTYDCTSIDPGSVDIGIRGCPPYITNDLGTMGTVAVTFDGGSFSFEAFLETFDVTGSVGEFLVGTARFRFSGN